MEILPSSVEPCREVSEELVTYEVETTPYELDVVNRDTLCHTPTLQIPTPSPRILRADCIETEAGALPLCQAEIVVKPPFVPFQEVDINLKEAENVLHKVEMTSKITPPVVAVLALKEMPFKERNREDGRRMIPPHIKVPPKKIFGYPERYKSPTDALVSPISKGLLARNRRPARTLAPVVPPKALENTFQNVVAEDHAAV